MVGSGIVRTMSGSEPTTERVLSAAERMQASGDPTTARWQNGKSCSDMWRHTGPVGLQMRSGSAPSAPVCMYNPHPKHVWRYFHSRNAVKHAVCDRQRLPCRLGKLTKSFSSGSLTLSIFLGNFANVVIVLFANVDLGSTASTSCGVSFRLYPRTHLRLDHLHDVV